MTAASRVSRAAALLALLAPTLACGLGDQLEESAFQAGCVAECAVNADRPVCEQYCECTYGWATRNDRMRELEQVEVGDGPMPPVMVEVMVACGSELYDAAFTRGCTGGCEGDPARCQTECACMLRELRGPGPRTESTRFLVENLDTQPPTPAGQARMDAAQAACLPE